MKTRHLLIAVLAVAGALASGFALAQQGQQGQQDQQSRDSAQSAEEKARAEAREARQRERRERAAQGGGQREAEEEDDRSRH